MSNPETNPELREKENRKIVSQPPVHGKQQMSSFLQVGYLNLLANCTDNLLHGLAVSATKQIYIIWDFVKVGKGD